MNLRSLYEQDGYWNKAKFLLASRADKPSFAQTRCAQTVRHLCSNAVTRELRGTRSPDQGAPAWILTAVGQARYVSVVCREWYGLAGVGRECRYLQQEYPVFSGVFVI